MFSILQPIISKFPTNITERNVKDALRLALQSSLSAACTFLIMNAYNLPQTFLALLSAILVVEPSIGHTISHAKGRILSTIVGSFIGFVFVSIIPYGYGTLVSLIVTMFIMNAVASFKPSWRYGVVASVAIALGSENDALTISFDRLMAMAIGIAVGLLITTVIWPEKSNKRAHKYLRSALKSACNRFEIAFENTKPDTNTKASTIADNFHSSLGQARDVATSIHFGDKEKTLQLIEATEKLYNSILIIQRVADSNAHFYVIDDDELKEYIGQFKEQTCNALYDFIQKNTIKNQEIKILEELINTIKKFILKLDSDPEKNTGRHTFIFGIEEVFENLNQLKKISGL